jgi:hypothetical protein
MTRDLRNVFIEQIARMTPYPDADAGPECALNSLIAAARQLVDGGHTADTPELLEACRSLLDMATDSRTHGPEIDRACDAIAGAKRNAADYDGPNMPGWEGGFARNH